MPDVDNKPIGEACCDNPQPRILEINGRTYCASCKRYLDKREPPQPPLPETPPAKLK